MTSRKSILSIIAATSGVVFALFGSVMGTYAWFESVLNREVEASHFQCYHQDIDIAEITLLKFEYPSDGLGGYDYLKPEDGYSHGWVKEYAYREDLNPHQFGEGVYNSGTHTWTSWERVSAMNLYDPLHIVVAGGTLYDLNCNAVYKIKLHSTTETSADLATIAARLANPSKTSEQIYLSTCVDFDFYVPSELSAVTTTYWPEFVQTKFDEIVAEKTAAADPEDPAPEAVEEILTPEAIEYFKVSYLAKPPATHHNLYSGDNRVTIGRKTATFAAGYTTLYVNVNYAPNRLKKYEENIGYGQVITAVYDYSILID